MLKTETVELGLDQCRGELAVGRGHGEQTAAHNTLGRSAFVDIDMGRVGTHHSVMRTAHGVDVQHIGPSAIEYKVDPCRGTEDLFE